MTVLSLKESRNCAGVNPAHEEGDIYALQARLQEMALAAATNRQDQLEHILLDVAGELHVIQRAHEDTLNEEEEKTGEAEGKLTRMEEVLEDRGILREVEAEVKKRAAEEEAAAEALRKKLAVA